MAAGRPLCLRQLGSISALAGEGDISFPRLKLLKQTALAHEFWEKFKQSSITRKKWDNIKVGYPICTNYGQCPILSGKLVGQLLGNGRTVQV